MTQTGTLPAVNDGPCAVEHARQLTHRQWADQANRLASGLAARGLGAGDRVAVRLHTRLEWLVVTRALAKLGAVQVALNHGLTPPEAEYILRDCDVTAVLADDPDMSALRAAWAHLGLRVAVSVDQRVAGVEVLDDLLAAEPTETWPDEPWFAPMIIYSSGTTGAPKGTPLRAWNRQPDPAALCDYRRAVGFDGAGAGPGNRTLMTMPMHHGAGPGATNVALRTGGTVYLVRRFDAEAALADIERHAITHWPTVPTMLRRIMLLPAEVRARYDVSSLRYLSVGAAPVPPELKNAVLDYFGEVLYEVYGCTEAGLISGCPPADHRRKPGSSGRPFRQVAVRILDADGTVLPPLATGEIAVRTPTVISGYIGRGRLPAEQLDAEGFYRTGDIGHLDAEGFLYLSDRRGDLIIAGGVNISPAEIEAVLTRHPDIALAAVIGVPDTDAGEVPIALVEPRPGSAPTPADVLAFCTGRLARYKRPRHVEIVGRLPVNAMGKVEKRRLRAPYWRGHHREI